MVILSNCLTDTVDEGCRKVANSLIRRIKKTEPQTMVVSYESASSLSDVHLKLNKFLLSRKLAALLRERREPLLYVPSPAKMYSTAIRLFVLSRYARWGLKVILPMEFPVDALSRRMILASGAEVISLSREAWLHYRQAFGERAIYLKAGVDTRRFLPVDAHTKHCLREKYGFSQERPIVLHVGHLNVGRNIGQLSKIADDFQVVLVVSTQTADQRDAVLRKQLEEQPNIRILDTFLSDIQEIYQLSDIYLFPVEQAGHCIDVPLSALEAAACGIPVVATPYGELKELLGKEGFYNIESFDARALNEQLRAILNERKSPRGSVLKYDWNLAVAALLPDGIQTEQEDMSV